ncbi:MAG TPA: hypothetical protein VEJ86_12180, partial [Candidatus Binataceae bacterium]|nr:hypothetical protein [Candidatus Binataceae bacterium]
MKRRILYARAEQWRALIERADQLISAPGFRAIKREGRTVAGIVTLDGAPAAFLKRSETSSWGRGLVERLRGSRASRALRGG